MLLNRKFSCMAVGLLVLLAGTSGFGQGLAGMQLFAPADASSYGNGPQPNEGFFFVFDGLYWSISSPRVSQIGNPFIGIRQAFTGNDVLNDVIDQHNSVDTSPFATDFTAGNRIELGRITDNRGWMVSVIQMRDIRQSFVSNQSTQMLFNDVAYGPRGLHLLDGQFTNPNSALPNLFLALPISFDNILVQNKECFWGIEVDYVGRSDQLHDAGFFEWYIGPRYIEFFDRFIVDANGGILDASNWDTKASNNIIAGQVGGRWFKKRGRWMLSSEGRFLAGLNCQNIIQTGQLGSNLTPPGAIDSGQPFEMRPTSFKNSAFIREFTPGAELRVEGRYQITRSVSFRAGWTGLWLGHIARASGMVNYTIDPDHAYMGILRDQNNQNLFINGLTIGIDVNR